MTEITRLTCEYRDNPLGIDVTVPRLSWQMRTDRYGARQTAYQILAATAPDQLTEDAANLWNSGRVDSDQSVQVEYAGVALQSRQRIYWVVTVWDENGDPTTSDVAWFEMSLLERDDWSADWIGTSFVGGPRSTLPAPYLRKTFDLSGEVQSARLYITALGVYECSINGQVIGDDVLAPGWTEYHKRIQYQVYDVTGLFQSGENVISAIVGDGWAAGHTGWNHRQQYVDRPQLLAQLEITLADGQTLTFTTDSTWRFQFGPITHSDLLMGEEYDARLEMPGWNQTGFDDHRWLPVETFTHPAMALVATNGPTVKRIQELAPISDPVDKGEGDRKRAIFDLGQNMVGWVRFRGLAPRGTTITLRFAEVLNDEGDLYTANLRSATATDYYTFGSDDAVAWEPKFTFHGFRYVELVNYPGELSRDLITGVVIHSDMAVTGHFACSEPLANQLQHNILWGQKGNFVDVPTDCPQRDERLGWTADIQVFLDTAAFNMDVAGFMTRWLRDLRDSQNPDGSVPPVVPYSAGLPTDGGPAWADATIICPWSLYLAYGDTRVLSENYETMARFLDYLVATSPGNIRCAPGYDGWRGFGDWLSINAGTPRDLIGTAFLAYDAKLMAQTAAVLGKAEDAEKYTALYEAIKKAFGERYFTGSTPPDFAVAVETVRKDSEFADRVSKVKWYEASGPISSELFNAELFTPTQTAYVLALHFGLLPPELEALATEELVADIESRDMHLSTGFVGSPYLPHVLTQHGQLDTAYALFAQTSWPSWLYAVTKGATTIWERWDGWTEENGFQSPGMNSFNHYAYGAIGMWLYNTVAGIQVDPQNPGYKHSLLRPQPGGNLDYAEASLQTQYGELASGWRLQDGRFEWTVVVPANTTATATLPSAYVSNVTLNEQPVTGATHALSAGRYTFVAH
jgi:alpha-L-rhamnosidase